MTQTTRENFIETLLHNGWEDISEKEEPLTEFHKDKNNFVHLFDNNSIHITVNNTHCICDDDFEN